MEQFIGMMSRARWRRGLLRLCTENNQSGRVMLSYHQERQHCRQCPSIVEFISSSCTEVHGRAGIQKNVAANIRVVLELLHIIFVRATPNFPIHIAQIIAIHIWPIRRELRAVAEKRTSMQSIEETFHDSFRHER